MIRKNGLLAAAVFLGLLLYACDDGGDFINAQFPEGGHRRFDDGRELFFSKPDWSVGSISWAPDMKRFAYTEKARTGSIRRISIHDVTNNTDRVLVDDGYTPIWSPVGEWVQYWDADGNAWIIKPDGSGKTLLWRWSANEMMGSFSWSPKGDLLAYSYKHRYNTRSYDIYIRNIANTEITRITRDESGDEMECFWSPDGRWIAFWKNEGPILEQGHRTPLSLIDASGHIVRVIWKDDDVQGVACLTLDGWSPDGRWMLMAISDSEEGAYIWALNVETREFRQVLSPTGDPNQRDLTATFGPDGKLYVIVENVATRLSSIWVVTPNLQ